MKKTITNKVANLLPVRHVEKEKDLKLIYELMPNLSDEKIMAIYFRFWEQLLIEDVANILGRSWSETNQLLEDSVKELRQGFLMSQMSAQLKAA